MEPRLDLNANALAANVVRHLISASTAVHTAVPTVTQELVRQPT